MNKFVLIFIVTLSIIGIGAFLVFQSNKQDSSSITGSNTTGEVTQPQNVQDNPTSLQAEQSRYVLFNSEVLESIKSPKRVLYFYANWCPTCKPVDEELSASISKIPEDLTIIRVNYNDTETDNEEKELARKYNITYQHTFVQIDETGSEIAKWNGGGLDTILSRLK